jgi:hypothetical protein
MNPESAEYVAGVRCSSQTDALPFLNQWKGHTKSSYKSFLSTDRFLNLVLGFRVESNMAGSCSHNWRGSYVWRTVIKALLLSINTYNLGLSQWTAINPLHIRLTAARSKNNTTEDELNVITGSENRDEVNESEISGSHGGERLGLLLPSGKWPRVVWQIWTNILKDNAAYLFLDLFYLDAGGAGSFKTLAYIYKTTRCHIPKDNNHNHCHVNLKCHIHIAASGLWNRAPVW